MRVGAGSHVPLARVGARGRVRPGARMRVCAGSGARMRGRVRKRIRAWARTSARDSARMRARVSRDAPTTPELPNGHDPHDQRDCGIR